MSSGLLGPLIQALAFALDALKDHNIPLWGKKSQGQVGN